MRPAPAPLPWLLAAIPLSLCLAFPLALAHSDLPQTSHQQQQQQELQQQEQFGTSCDDGSAQGDCQKDGVGSRPEHLLLQRTGLALTSTEEVETGTETELSSSSSSSSSFVGEGGSEGGLVLLGEGLRLDALAVQHLQATYRSPRGVGLVISNGLTAIRSCLTSLTKDDPDIQSGFTTMGSKLVTVISDMLPSEYLNGVNFGRFAASVQQQLRALSQENDILDGVRNYTSLGNTDNLMQILSASLEKMMAIATEEFGQNTGFNVARYISSLNDMMEGASDSLSFVKDGDQEEGIASIWKGVKASIDALMPSDSLSNETYTEVVAGTQDVLGSFMDDVLTFVRAFMDSEVCWKRSQAREKVRPTICPSGYSFTQGQWCMPSSGTAKAIRASCPDGLLAQGSWCLLPCASEYQSFLRHCKQRCAGAYSIESPLMCGSVKGAIAVAIVEIVAKTAIAAVTQVGLVNIALSAGYVFVSTMTTVLNAFANFAKPFGFPHCPADLANTEAMSLEDALARIRNRDSTTTPLPALPGPTPDSDGSLGAPVAVVAGSGHAAAANSVTRLPLPQRVPAATTTAAAGLADAGDESDEGDDEEAGEQRLVREQLRRERRP